MGLMRSECLGNARSRRNLFVLFGRCGVHIYVCKYIYALGCNEEMEFIHVSVTSAWFWAEFDMGSALPCLEWAREERWFRLGCKQWAI